MLRVHVTTAHGLGQAWLAELATHAWPGADIASLPAHELQRAEPISGLLLARLDADPVRYPKFVAACERWQETGWVVVFGRQFDPGVLRWVLRAGLGGYLLASQPREVLVQQLHDALVRETAHAPQVWQALFARLRVPVFGAVASLPHLTGRERDVLLAIGAGASNAQVADRLGLSRATVASYVKQVYRKLGIRTRAQAALKAAEFEPISPSGPAW